MIQLVSRIRSVFPARLRSRLPLRIRVVSVTPQRSRLLNRIYRGRQKAANVLSFRYDSDYGEIILCPAIIRKEARRDGHTKEFETLRMVLHAMVHLSGVHHEASKKAEAFTDRIERSLLGRLSSEFRHDAEKKNIHMKNERRRG